MSMRTITALLSAGTLAAIGCTAPPLAPEAPLNVSPVTLSSNEWRVVDHVFVVTDASGTMYMEETFPKAKSLSQSFVAALPTGSERARNAGRYNAASIGFGGAERVAKPLGPFDRSSLRSAVDSVEVMGSVDGRGGSTPIHKVIDEIATQLEGKPGRAAVVLFTDGEPDEPEMALARASALAASHSDGVCFHGVQTGDDPAGERFLRTLAEASGCGSYRNASTVGNSTALASFTRGVMVGNAPSQRALPAVAAPDPCAGMTLKGVQFGFDEADLLEGSAAVLDRAAAQLNKCPTVKLRVEGHTDSIGTEAYNQSLSQRRAETVRRYLEGAGVSGSRLVSEGVGEAQPIQPNSTKEGRMENRRVDLVPR